MNLHTDTIDCPECHGNGAVEINRNGDERRCGRCRGTGTLDMSRLISGGLPFVLHTPERFEQQFLGQPVYVNAHDCHLEYGGPEEGGWHFEVGVPLESERCFSYVDAIDTWVRIRAKHPLGSSTYGSRVQVALSTKPAEAFPTERPRYC